VFGRFEASRPNELWTGDALHGPVITGRKAYLSAVDDYSRLAYTEALANEKGQTAAAFWLRAADFFARYGMDEIRACLTDNGSCYRSWDWRDALEITSTKHRRTRPYTPPLTGQSSGSADARLVSG
jgi:transposase InsO family protein